MAKRAPAGETAYDPLDQNLAQSVMQPAKLARDVKATGGHDAVRERQSPPPHGTYTDVQRGMAAVAKHVRPTTPHATLRLRGFTRAKRVLLTPEEERHIERLVDRVAEHMGSSLKLSHVLRACMALLCHAETELIRQADAHPLVRPANGDAVALAQFEHGIARLLSLALRDAPPIR
jgi:hypothetical protein